MPIDMDWTSEAAEDATADALLRAMCTCPQSQGLKVEEEVLNAMLTRAAPADPTPPAVSSHEMQTCTVHLKLPDGKINSNPFPASENVAVVWDWAQPLLQENGIHNACQFDATASQGTDGVQRFLREGTAVNAAGLGSPLRARCHARTQPVLGLLTQNIHTLTASHSRGWERTPGASRCAICTFSQVSACPLSGRYSVYCCAGACTGKVPSLWASV